jgi:hypothetical protein
MNQFASEQEKFDTMRDKLTASVLSDVLDSLGARSQAMRADIRPLYPSAIVVGRAYTVLSADIFQTIDDPYKGEIEAVDSLKPDDVMVVCTNRSTAPPVPASGESCYPPPPGPERRGAWCSTAIPGTSPRLPR